MYNTDILLSRLSHARSSLTLSSLIPFSFSELRSRYNDVLSLGELQYLYGEAQEQKKRNQLLEARALTQANPQLPFAVKNGLPQSAQTYGYHELFGSCANTFVGAESVASMFSPAAYLTELYREAQGLHLASSSYHLEKRRPDLASLVLNQQNMDEEVSTLTLSNTILLSQVQKHTGKKDDALWQFLATERKSTIIPYHQPYETLRNALLALDPTLEGLYQNPALLKQADSNSLLALMANISPELHAILAEDINENNHGELFDQNFSVLPGKLTNIDDVADYYGLNRDYIAQFTGDINVNYNNADENLAEGPIYINNRLTTLIKEADNSFNIYYISSREEANAYQCYYLELLPLGGTRYTLRFSMTKTEKESSDFSIQTEQTDPSSPDEILLEEDPFVPEANKHYSRDITLTADQIKNGVTIGLMRHSSMSRGFYWTSCSFNIQKLPLTLYLLKMNKAIRLCQATGLTPNELESIFYTNDNISGTINDRVLIRLFYTLFYRTRYSLPTEQALTLAGGLIARGALDNETSFFDRLFNTPPLDGVHFSSNDDVAISIDPMKGVSSHAHNALLRGLGVTHSELCQLATITALPVTNNTITLSLHTISALYRMVLLARLHHLTVNELHLLNRASGKTPEPLAEYVEWLYAISNWISNTGLSAASLWAMSTQEYGETLTQEMRNLSATIAAGVTQPAINTATDDAALCRLAAPYISEAMNLSSTGVAEHLLQWCAASESLKGITLQRFMTLLISGDTISDAEQQELALYLQVLAQHALMCGALQLSEAEVAMFALIDDNPLLESPPAATRRGVDLILSLSRFHLWVNSLGQNSTDILAALCDKTLNTAQLSDAMGLDDSLLKQALSYVKPEKKTLGNWQTIDEMLQWVALSRTLNSTPSSIKQLIDIRLNDIARAVPSWEKWKAVSLAFASALTPKQAQDLAANAAGRVSDVLCGWFLKNVAVEGVNPKTRDDLYSYFLIDNQVSEQIKTTRIAEAIAGLQLYVNRALNRIEPNTVSDVSTRQFFLDWELNSRYSTWGGISRLAYFPEIYVDPLQRIGQTKMMDELLQNINQSQLSQDAVGDAFKTYLARFETVADLKVISAYHDNVNTDNGLTWFVGRGREAQAEYYWRHVDISRFQDGKLAANTWSEWVKIDAPMHAFRDMVRPVVFRDRLHLTWVERDDIAKNGSGSDTEMLFRYTLKMVFLRHDGNWSSPWSYDVTEQIKECLNLRDETDEESLDQLGLCVSYCQDESTLMVFVYKIQWDYHFDEGSYVKGIKINATGTHQVINNTELKRYRLFGKMFDVHYKSNNLRLIRKVNYRFAFNFEIKTSLGGEEFSVTNDTTAMAFGSLKNYSIAKITHTVSSKSLQITFTGASFSICYFGSSQLDRLKAKAMSLNRPDGSTSHGDVFIIPMLVTPYGGRATDCAPIITYNSTKGYWVTAQQDTDNGQNKIITMLTEIDPENKIAGEIEILENYPFKGYFSNDGSNKSKTAVFPNDFFRFRGGLPVGVYSIDGSDAEGLKIYGSNKNYQWFEFNTAVDPKDITIEVTCGNLTQEFNAKEYIDSDNLPVGNFYNMTYEFKPLNIDVGEIDFKKNQAEISIKLSAKGKSHTSFGVAEATLRVNRVDYAQETILQLHETADGVQYMQHGADRIRLNTQLAPALVSRADRGIDAILSMETQLLPEAKLGPGTFVTLTFDKYNEDIHGTSLAFSIELVSVYEKDDEFPIYSGTLSESEQTVVTLFVPANPLKFDYAHYVRLRARWQKKVSDTITLWNKYNDSESWQLNSTLFTGLHNVDVLRKTTIPLDFNSSSALYYWELFYYVPMMCFRRFLQEKKFSEARKWLSYVYDPNGYIVNGKIASWTWNCRPLEETTSCNANPLDAIDPDAVAQHDPTHYKIATFMSYVEMLITRGDMCYRELTRDALNEAKMWYIHALEIMGQVPMDAGNASWTAPVLKEAASQTQQVAMQTVLSKIDKGETISGHERTANSLTRLFLPEFNPMLTEYWTTLRQRMFNLRHNLSLSGQPLSLPIYAEPVDPKALQASQVKGSQGGSSLPAAMLSLYRFPIILEQARNLTSQLVQFGSSLLSMIGNYDAEKLSTLMLQQGMELSLQSIAIQQRSLNEIDANIAELTESRRGAQQRLDKYTQLYNEDVSSGERQAMALSDTASTINLAGRVLGMVGGGLDLVPNIFGLAAGGARWGALAHAGASGMSLEANALLAMADKVSRSEMYRRRRQEWEIQRDSAQSEVNQIDARIAGVNISREAAAMQVSFLKTQHGHTLAQLELMQRKFTSEILYNWMRAKLSAIYHQFFDITQSFCLMAQASLRRELSDDGLTFVHGSAWNGSTGGLMAGETLMLSLADMEKAWTERDERALEVTRTVSLTQVYAELKPDNFIFTDAVSNNVQASGNKTFGSGGNEVKRNGSVLTVSVKLSDLNIKNDYPGEVLTIGKNRRIKQISVTLPALVGPYENVRALLNYGGSMEMAKGCSAIAISHGINDSGQFVLDFNDARYLPFEGIPVDDTGSLTLSFPDATKGQKTLLESLSDIILHINYTIRS